MPFRRFVCRALTVFTAFVLSALPVRAWAAGISQQGVITRKNPNTHPDQVTVNFISQSDCLANDEFNFPMSITPDGIGNQLEVWAAIGGADCSDTAVRTSANPQCTKVYGQTATMMLQTVTIRMQDIALTEVPTFGQVVGQGTAATCTKTSGTAGDQVTLWFLLLTSNTVTGSFKWSTTIDLLKPTPPTSVVAEGASSFVKMS